MIYFTSESQSVEWLEIKKNKSMPKIVLIPPIVFIVSGRN